MQRGARLDAPATLHHVIIRGIEKGDIVRDEEDRKEFLRRMGELAQGMDLHLCIRIDDKPCPYTVDKRSAGYIDVHAPFAFQLCTIFRSPSSTSGSSLSEQR